MRTAGIAEIKAGLSEILAGVKGGEEVVVTEHGRPIARIVPLLPGTDGALDSTAEELVRAGVLAPPKAGLRPDFWSLRRPPDPEALALSALIDERRSGR